MDVSQIKTFRLKHGELTAYMGRKKEVVIPEGIRSLRPDVFSRSGARKIVLPVGVYRTGIAIFSGCTSLQEVVLPMGLRDIGAFSFRGCSIRSIDIPDTVEHIGGHAFFGCPIGSVSVPEGCELGSDLSSFPEGCKVTFRPVDKTPKPTDYAVRGDTVIAYCGFASDLVLPGEATKVYERAFSGLRGLERADLSHVKEIGENAFWGCDRLRYVRFGEELTRIGELAFEGCDSLARVEIPSTVEEIGFAAFHCTSIEEVVIPANCTLGKEAFPSACKIVRRDR